MLKLAELFWDPIANWDCVDEDDYGATAEEHAD